MVAITVGVLEDERPQAELLEAWLTEAGYHCYHCPTGASFLEMASASPADIIILDWQLPDCDGIDILKQLRSKLKFDGPVLFATARDSEEDIVTALEAGADDYVTKPLRRAELLARVSALWRRSGAEPGKQLVLGPITLDTDNCRALLDGKEVKLTPTEFRLAACVLSNPGKLLSREYLLHEVWGVNASLDTRTVDVHMSRVRKLLQIGPNIGHCIKTVYRHGYRLETL